MTRFHLVRHGPTHATGMVGWTDLPADLSDTGTISRLRDYLPEQAVVVSSDLLRAVTTADAIQGKRTRLPHDPDLREINFGRWEMRKWADIEAEDPDRIRAYWEHPGDVRPPEGESWNQVSARVDAAVDRLAISHQGHDIVLVAHFGVILTQIQRALRLTADEAFAHRIDNLSVTTMTIADVWNADPINHIP